MSREQGSINWNEVIKKEARGKNGEDQGEVQEVRDMYILVQNGLLSKEKFYVPQNEVDSYDGEVLRFKVSEEDIRTKYILGICLLQHLPSLIVAQIIWKKMQPSKKHPNQTSSH